MAIEQAIQLGHKGNQISKHITGTSEVSVERSLTATGTGALLGTVAGEATVLGATAVASTLGTGAVATAAGTIAAVAAPVVVPLAIAAGGFALLFSLFDD